MHAVSPGRREVSRRFNLMLEFQILGGAGCDNALFIKANSGQHVTRLMFDCGEGCPGDVPSGEMKDLDVLFFSHLHMDHIAGFDALFRGLYDREDRANQIWGPVGTSRILQHRFRGFLWNLHGDTRVAWQVNDVLPGEIRTSSYVLSESFAVAHPGGVRPRNPALWQNEDVVVEALEMDHRTPSLAYVVREKPRWNIDTAKLEELGLRPGPWMKALKDPAPEEAVNLDVNGEVHDLHELRQALLVETPGQSVAYLTDFLLDEPARVRLSKALQGVTAMVCESQYRDADHELALKHRHMTSIQAACLARDANVGELILIHVSQRYSEAQWAELLTEARQVFPKTRFANHWKIG